MSRVVISILIIIALVLVAIGVVWVVVVNVLERGEEQVNVGISNVFTNPKSCLDILTRGYASEDGVYLIDPLGNGNKFEVYCDMTTDGGGWTLLMKATGSGNTFQYDANYWTTANVLNEDDVSLNDGDAKYRSFNEVKITNIMAKWPTINHIMDESVNSQTALDLFNTENVLGHEETSGGVGDYGDFISDFASQSGWQDYGFNVGAGCNRRVRWGWVWNNELNHCVNSDATAGIGLNYVYSTTMGSWVTCCASKSAGGYPYSVQIWGR